MEPRDYDVRSGLRREAADHGGSIVQHIWFSGLNPYVKNEQIRWCPSDQDRGGDPDLWGSYLMNGLLTVGGRPMHIVEKPSETILMGERATNWRNMAGHDPSDDHSPYYDLCYDCWLPDGSWSAGTVTWPPVFEARLDTTRHNGGANYGFLDGHAKWMRWNETVKSHANNLHDLH